MVLVQAELLKKYSFRFYGEVHCEVCCEIVHYHFDCPICNTKNVPTSMYEYVFKCLEKVGDTFECEKCKAEFELIKRGWNFNEWKFKLIKNGK